MAALVVAALLFLALRPSRPDVGAPVEVKKADLVLSVELEGELAAVRSTEIGVPPVSEVDFKIAFLAPEGQPVKKGDRVLKLDTEMLERQLAEKRAELAEAQKKVEQKEIDLGMKLLDLEQQAAQARADLGKAQLKVEVPPEVEQRIELEKALLDKKGRERDLQNLEAEGRVTQALDRRRARLAPPAAGPRRGPGGRARGRDREDGRPGAAGRDRGLPRRTGGTRRRRWATRSGSARWCSPCPTSRR